MLRTETIAGYHGNGNPDAADGIGTAARLADPYDLAIGKDGTIYIGEKWGCTIRKMERNGMVTTLAGKNGKAGYIDGDRDQARFEGIMGIDVDSNNNVYGVELFNGKVRKVDPGGTVTTIATKTTDEYYYDVLWTGTKMLLGRTGGMFVVNDMYNQTLFGNKTYGHIRRIVKDSHGDIWVIGSGNDIDHFTADGQYTMPPPLSGIQVENLVLLAVTDDGVIYVTDSYRKQVIRVDPDGRRTVFAGTGKSYVQDGNFETASFGSVAGIIFDTDGNLVVVDNASANLRKIYIE